jgi:hypothetical protein
MKSCLHIFIQEGGEPIKMKEMELIMKIQENVDDQIFERAK